MQKTEIFENTSYSFVKRQLITILFKVAIGPVLTVTNKRLCFEKGIDNTFLLEQCERLSYSYRIHLETEQCRRAVFSSSKMDRNKNAAV